MLKAMLKAIPSLRYLKVLDFLRSLRFLRTSGGSCRRSATTWRKRLSSATARAREMAAFKEEFKEEFRSTFGINVKMSIQFQDILILLIQFHT